MIIDLYFSKAYHRLDDVWFRRLNDRILRQVKRWDYSRQYCDGVMAVFLHPEVEEDGSKEGST